VIGIAREKGESGYVDKGQNLWPAVHRSDAATLYRLIVEKQPVQKIFHAVAETGISFREIAEAIGKGLNLPVVSKSGENVAAHFGWFAHFASIDCPASSEKTREVLDWKLEGAGLIEDLSACYFLN
jgi:hypothetical protein